MTDSGFVRQPYAWCNMNLKFWLLPGRECLWWILKMRGNKPVQIGAQWSGLSAKSSSDWYRALMDRGSPSMSDENVYLRLFMELWDKRCYKGVDNTGIHRILEKTVLISTQSTAPLGPSKTKNVFGKTAPSVRILSSLETAPRAPTAVGLISCSLTWKGWNAEQNIRGRAESGRRGCGWARHLGS